MDADAANLNKMRATPQACHRWRDGFSRAYLGLKSLAAKSTPCSSSGGTSVKIGDYETAVDVGALAYVAAGSGGGYRTW
jgi:hypothetical protein